MTSQPILQAIAIHILSNISQRKGNKTMKLGQLIEYNKRNIFLFYSLRYWAICVYNYLYFDTWSKSQDKNLNILRMKRAFEVK